MTTAPATARATPLRPPVSWLGTAYLTFKPCGWIEWSRNVRPAQARYALSTERITADGL